MGNSTPDENTVSTVCGPLPWNKMRNNLWKMFPPFLPTVTQSKHYANTMQCHPPNIYKFISQLGLEGVNIPLWTFLFPLITLLSKEASHPWEQFTFVILKLIFIFRKRIGGTLLLESCATTVQSWWDGSSLHFSLDTSQHKRNSPAIRWWRCDQHLAQCQQGLAPAPPRPPAYKWYR